MKIYNSLTQDYQKINQKTLNIYACGPTVYNYIHIGNARPNILLDTLIRYWEFKGIKVNFLQNITDIDDKIIAKAAAEKKSEVAIAEFYTKAYLNDLKSLNIKMPTKIMPISQSIPAMIKFIEDLVVKKFAYVVDGNVYFAIDQWKDKYGQLANKKITDLISGQRVDVDLKKQNPLDFALWKKTETGKTWPSPFGDGRPGWHTECVVLIQDYFHQKTIDIHVGGIDLKFPHHENERIQFWAKNKKELAHVWLHNGHLNFQDQKMSKSLGNVFLVKDFVKKYSANLLRWMFLTTNYKQPLNLTPDLIHQGETFFEKINNLKKKMLMAKFFNDLDQKMPSLNIITAFTEAMEDDYNSAEVLSIIESGIKHLNQGINQKINFQNLEKTYLELKQILEILGFDAILDLTLVKDDQKIFTQWSQAVKGKDYAAADKLRQQLQKKGLA